MELNEFLEWIKEQDKMEDLQNFADRICDQQKHIIADCFLNFPVIRLGVLDINSPKIEEL